VLAGIVAIFSSLLKPRLAGNKISYPEQQSCTPGSIVWPVETAPFQPPSRLILDSFAYPVKRNV
jgi:hypothetical protein